jgi:transglutaminase-like putative cysteine protease
MRYIAIAAALLIVVLTSCTPPPNNPTPANGTRGQSSIESPTEPIEPPTKPIAPIEPPITANVDESVNFEKHDPPVRRAFKFYYAGNITDLTPGAKARVWLPEATSSESQTVERVAIDLPGQHQETRDEEYGNKVIYFEATANEKGEIPFSVEYQVERLELVASNSPKAAELARYLKPNKLVPTDKTLLNVVFAGTDKPAGDPAKIARSLYDQIGLRMKYDKPDGGEWGRGDAVWACDSRFGNCTDFHSLFIALCRESKIPSYFEIGFPISPDVKSGDVGGYHCWALFADEGKWIPVDISEADKHPEMREYYFGNLTADRVTFTRGRDLVLKPATAVKNVNFFVYPHIEVDGKVHKKFTKGFRYEQSQLGQ